MKIVISKNKDGNGYYTKLTNEYNNQKSEMYMSLQIPKGNDLEYGLYEVDGFLSCFTAKDGTVKPKFVVTNAIPTTKYEKKGIVSPYDGMQKVEVKPEEDPFDAFGREIEVTDNFLE